MYFLEDLCILPRSTCTLGWDSLDEIITVVPFGFGIVNLHKQTRRSKVQPILQGSNQVLKLMHSASNYPLNSAPFKSNILPGGPPQEAFSQGSRVRTLLFGGAVYFTTVGIPILGYLCNPRKQEVPSLLFLSYPGAQFKRGCFPGTVIGPIDLCLLSHAPTTLCPQEDQAGQGNCNSDSIMVAKAIVVHHWHMDGLLPIQILTTVSKPAVSE